RPRRRKSQGDGTRASKQPESEEPDLLRAGEIADRPEHWKHHGREDRGDGDRVAPRRGGRSEGVGEVALEDDRQDRGGEGRIAEVVQGPGEDLAPGGGPRRY